jgi:hypothetical protein
MLFHIMCVLDALETTEGIQEFNGHELQSGLWCEPSPAVVAVLGGGKDQM